LVRIRPYAAIGQLAVLTIGAMLVSIFNPSIHYQHVVSEVHSWFRPWFSRTFILVYIGFVVTVVIYWLQRYHSLRRQIDAAISVLKAVRAIDPYGEQHFGKEGYSPRAADIRAQNDYNQIMGKGYFQNFQVPSEPYASLIQNAGNGWPLNDETVETANIALWKITAFNQLVQQQTDFNAMHMAEIVGGTITATERQDLAKSAKAISVMIHGTAISDTRWYPKLIEELERNIAELEERKTHKFRIGRVHSDTQ
jgi:hypothetical protein